ncbi:uncharacterized protein LOC117577904 isoform X2 [Drosophila albomicans]|uniref:Uncharacterized protein LOC117577904 isoform X2 n=1 Tax=Drosophila albomicans TaxID=7291 RepID=A0A6P8ZFV1_DROAB|nr:uncharacterized protein LOC117577904 isoform X2 [Drosophila albomicans]
MVQPNRENFDTTSTALNADQLLCGAFNALQKLWTQGRRCASFVMSELGGNEFIEAAINWCLEHPDIAICVMAASFVILLPLLIIFGFGIATMVITFTGILVLEGTLLTVVLMIFLVCIASLAIAVAVFAVVAYFGFSQIHEFFGLSRHRDAFVKFVQETRTENVESTQ